MDPFLNSGGWFDNRWHQTLRHQPRARLSSSAVILVAVLAAVGGAAILLGDRSPPPTEPAVASGPRLLIRM